MRERSIRWRPGFCPLPSAEATKTVPFLMDRAKRPTASPSAGAKRRRRTIQEGAVIETSAVRPSAAAIAAALPAVHGRDLAGAAQVLGRAHRRRAGLRHRPRRGRGRARGAARGDPRGPAFGNPGRGPFGARNPLRQRDLRPLPGEGPSPGSWARWGTSRPSAGPSSDPSTRRAAISLESLGAICESARHLERLAPVETVLGRHPGTRRDHGASAASTPGRSVIVRPQAFLAMTGSDDRAIPARSGRRIWEKTSRTSPKRWKRAPRGARRARSRGIPSDACVSNLAGREPKRSYPMSISPDRKAAVIKEYAQGAKDTGSPEVQVAILSERDQQPHRAFRRQQERQTTPPRLLKMVATRRSLLDYLKKKDGGALRGADQASGPSALESSLKHRHTLFLRHGRAVVPAIHGAARSESRRPSVFAC